MSPLATVPASLLQPAATLQVAPRGATPDKIKTLAHDFEASMIAALLQPVFDALPTDGTFGGGQGEAAYKSLMVDAFARQTVKAGGLGLSSAIQSEIIRLQGSAT